MAVSRLYIYPKDVMLITGKHNSTACRKLQLIRSAYGKETGKPVTIREYCEYEGISEKEVRAVIK